MVLGFPHNDVFARTLVPGDWGFNSHLCLRKGINVLFSRLPGTGKTMVASAIAKAFSTPMNFPVLISSDCDRLRQRHLSEPLFAATAPETLSPQPHPG